MAEFGFMRYNLLRNALRQAQGINLLRFASCLQTFGADFHLLPIKPFGL